MRTECSFPHPRNVNAIKDDSDWALHSAKALQEIGVAEEGGKEFEEEIHDRALGI